VVGGDRPAWSDEFGEQCAPVKSLSPGDNFQWYSNSIHTYDSTTCTSSSTLATGSTRSGAWRSRTRTTSASSRQPIRTAGNTRRRGPLPSGGRALASARWFVVASGSAQSSRSSKIDLSRSLAQLFLCV
jgi:hypothetical protein